MHTRKTKNKAKLTLWPQIYLYLSCFRGSVLRVNLGLAEGEEWGLEKGTGQTKQKEADKSDRKGGGDKEIIRWEDGKEDRSSLEI